MIIKRSLGTLTASCVFFDGSGGSGRVGVACSSGHDWLAAAFLVLNLSLYVPACMYAAVRTVVHDISFTRVFLWVWWW